MQTEFPKHTQPGNPPVELTVVVVTLVDLKHLERCLVALEEQQTNINFEVIVPVDTRFPAVTEVEARFPLWRFYYNSGIRTYAELRTCGVGAARGRLVAITEDHCVPGPDWVEQIVAAHRNPPLAIGGPVEKITPDGLLNWSVYLLDYLRYSPPVTEGETHELTDLNVSYKMSALEEIRPVWEEEFHEPNVHAALEARGGTLWMAPQLMVRQRRALTLDHALWDRFAFGRLFGSTRVRGVPTGKRLVYAALTPLLPVLLTVRLFRHVLHKRRHRLVFAGALPFILLLAAAWACGECTGYLTGRADPRLQPQAARDPDKQALKQQ